MHNRATNLIKTALLTLSATAASTAVANAATINVDTFIDDNTANGNCSLREAIISANTDTAIDACTSGTTGVDTIQLAAGTYTLSIEGRGEDSSATGDLDITTITTNGSYVIKGAATTGAPLTIIDADNIDRIFDIFNPATEGNFATGPFDGVTVTLEDLKLINGLANETLVDPDAVSETNQANGGAVYSWRFNNLTITNCEFENNQAVWDGKLGTLDGPDATSGTDDDIDERTLSGHGGAVYSRGNLTISNSMFSNNTAFTTFDDNGDGIIEGENEKSGNGGAVFTAFPSSISDSTFSNNTASNGGGLNTTGGDPATGPEMEISGSTFVGNSAVMGGGINNVSPQVTLFITNSTFSTNTTTDMGGGVNSDAAVHLKHVTLVNNRVTNSDQHGAGINYFGPAGQFFLSNTLLSNNRGMKINVNCGCTGGTILACSTLEVDSNGGNISNDFTCALDTSKGDLVGPDPQVLPLADNGGPTQTHAIDFDSVAIDAGLTANCIDAVPAILKDQRGVDRNPLVDGNADGVAGCDVGAYERVTSNTDMILNSLELSATEISVGDEVSITVAASTTGPDSITSARIDVIMPAELTFVSGIINGGSACGLIGDSLVSCEIGEMAATNSTGVTVVAAANESGSVSVKAQFSAIESDTDSSNNSAAAALTINALPVVVDDTTTSSSSSSGGLCSYNPNARFDIVLPGLLFISLGYLGLRRTKE